MTGLIVFTSALSTKSGGIFMKSMNTYEVSEKTPVFEFSPTYIPSVAIQAALISGFVIALAYFVPVTIPVSIVYMVLDRLGPIQLVVTYVISYLLAFLTALRNFKRQAEKEIYRVYDDRIECYYGKSALYQAAVIFEYHEIEEIKLVTKPYLEANGLSDIIIRTKYPRRNRYTHIYHIENAEQIKDYIENKLAKPYGTYDTEHNR